MKSRPGLLLVAAAIAAAVFLMLTARDRATSQHAANEEAVQAGSAAAPAPGQETDSGRRDAASRRNTHRETTAAEGSLRGTQVAGGLIVDADGNFFPTAEAVALFEYFLSTMGEKTPEQILAAIRDEIRRRLEPPAEEQALAFLDRYMLYRDRGVALGLGDAGDDDLRARFDRLRALRREIFGEEVAARLFGDEEAEAEVTIRQHEVAADPNLSDEEKAAAIEKLYDDLPAPAREAREQALAVTRLQQDEEKIRASGGSDADIRALRVERFGEEAANRLEDLDRERAEWDSRFQDYRAERARVLADKSLSDSGRQTALERLLQDRFDENERIRAQALDGLYDQQAAAR